MEDHVIDSGTGHLRVTRDGGRIAELCCSDDSGNLLSLGASAPVHGGDRLWVAPELDVFYTDPRDPETWRCPPEVDPGHWSLDAVDGEVELSQEALGATLRRRVRGLSDLPVSTSLGWTGYRITDEVVTDEHLSAWHIVMVDAPAQIYVRNGRDPVVYYPPGPDEVDGWIDVRDVPPRWKVGYPAPSDGRIVLAALDDREPGGLVILLADTDPEGTYIDVPPSGAAAVPVQVYGSGGGGFCELEHHAPLESRRTSAVVLGAWGPGEARLDLVADLAGRPLGEA